MGTSMQPVWFRVCPRISFTLAHIISSGRLPRSYRSLQTVRMPCSGASCISDNSTGDFRRFNTHVSALFPENPNLREQYATNYHGLRVARSGWLTSLIECFTIWEIWSLDTATYPNSLQWGCLGNFFSHNDIHFCCFRIYSLAHRVVNHNLLFSTVRVCGIVTIFIRSSTSFSYANEMPLSQTSVIKVSPSHVCTQQVCMYIDIGQFTTNWSHRPISRNANKSSK